MAPRLTKAERLEKMEEAVNLSARGKTVQFIADKLEVTWNTASKLVDDGYANRAEHRSDDREKAIATYQAIISEGWKRLETLKDSSLNVSGILNAIRAAQERIDKLTGSEAPQKSVLTVRDERTPTEAEAAELADDIARLEDEISALEAGASRGEEGAI